MQFDPRIQFPRLALVPVLAAALTVGALTAGPGSEPSAGALEAATPVWQPRLTATELREKAARIDTAIDRDLKAHGVAANPASDDAAFVRRAYLQIAGRIPTAAETSAFLQARGRDKRGDLIDQLLGSPGHFARMFPYWADVFRLKDRIAPQVSGEPYIHYLRESVAANKPYDDLVREMLTAEGPAHQRGNGATGYFLRDRGMPNDNMANTLRIFTGLRLECAQCHDHPFTDWKQKDFFGMVAFTGGLRYRTSPVEGESGRALVEEGRRLREELGPNFARALARIVQVASTGLEGSGTGAARLPDDYKYADAAPNQLVTAHTLFGAQADLPDPRERATQRRRRQGGRDAARTPAGQVNSRGAFADWLVSPANPMFARTIANRMWKFTMGEGAIEPFDDVRLDTQAANPALMSALETLMVELDFDLREFQRVILHTDAWQREAVGAETDPEAPFRFQGPKMQRMSAEQVWDSLVALVVPDLDAKLLPPLTPRAEAVYGRFEELTSLTPEGLRKLAEVESLRYSDPEAYRAMQGEKRAAERMERQDLQRQARPVLRDLAQARRRGDKAAQQRLLAQLETMGADPPELMRQARTLQGLVRAADLPQPAEPGHLLQQFGQSDREQIDGGHRDANVPQILALMNGFVEDKLLGNEFALAMTALERATGPEDRIRLAFLQVLSRAPDRAELATWTKEMERDPGPAGRDLMWTLLNTHEFLFVR
ncbi:MAG TPA: DUF1549 domain-containing protein [Planctomycetota bacterium]